jgi:luciferase family oxidoreductase group 1
MAIEAEAGQGGGNANDPSPSWPVPLSVLDLAPVVAGSSPAEALRRSIQLAQHAEALGYRRFWVAEHHNMPGVASSAPAVLLAHVAAATSRLRVGSGGVMLPNHAPLVIAEQFGTLEALHPGRIDLGLGRAPGTDLATARALRRTVPTGGADDFARQVQDLFGFFRDGFAAGHPYADITPVPARGYLPEVWILGSSDYGAQLAGLLGLPFSFAYHFAPDNLAVALERYRAAFRPSAAFQRPHVMVAASVLVAESDEEADWLAGPARLNVLRIRTNRRAPLPTPEEAAAYPYSDAERAALALWTASHVVGSPTTARAQLADLLERTGADELMIATSAHGFGDRERSLSLLVGGAPG